jgi:lysophospholipase L1-like esterase
VLVARSRPLRLVALGDSTSCGEGVGVRVAAARTWPALLAAALGAEPTCLARPGARVRDVLAEQVAPALALRPDLVTLLIGVNDVLRSTSCELTDELTVAVQPFAATNILLLRLYDPTELLPLPQAVRSAVLRRVGQLNAAVDAVVRTTGARVLDLAGLPALRPRDAWAVDRLHPNEHGHAVIASAGVAALGGAGACGGSAQAPSGRFAEVVWLTRHGLPYLAVHGRRMAPGALAALTRR